MEYNTIPLELLSLGVHGKEPDSICGKWISSFYCMGLGDLRCRVFLCLPPHQHQARSPLLLLLFCGCRAAWATLGLMGMEIKLQESLCWLGAEVFTPPHPALRMPMGGRCHHSQAVTVCNFGILNYF